jgi:hypothetical protein
MAGDVLLAAAGPGEGELLVDLGEEGEHPLAVFPELGVPRVDPGAQRIHGAHLTGR